jgi:hypothetical protein
MKSRCLKFLPRAGLLALLAALGMAHVPQARADSMLLANTTMVTGSQSAVFSFTAPSSGYVTATLQNLAWQEPLKSLSFQATSGTNVMSSWSMPTAQAEQKTETFQVSAGNYFAHIMANTEGDGDVGLFSLNLSFSPNAVPLPASSLLLLTGIFGLFLVSRNRRSLGF